MAAQNKKSTAAKMKIHTNTEEKIKEKQ